MSEDNNKCNEDGVNEKYKFWQSHVYAREQSGIRQTNYCSREGLSIKIFGYWKRKLLNKSEGVSFVPVSIKSSHAASVRHSAFLRLVIGNSLSIEVDDGFNPATLRILLDAIGSGFDVNAVFRYTCLSCHW